MEVRLESTEGLGKSAEVWLDGSLLTVCDGVSAPGRRHPPGVLPGVKFSYMSAEGFTWADAAALNPRRDRKLVQVRGWAYAGYGRVVSIMPVVIDFGPLRMEDAHWSSDESLVGQYVRVPIDRLELSFAAAPDWPSGMENPPGQRRAERAPEQDQEEP